MLKMFFSDVKVSAPLMFELLHGFWVVFFGGGGFLEKEVGKGRHGVGLPHLSR